MSEKPKWTATRFECELGTVCILADEKEWTAFRSSGWPGEEECIGNFPTAEEAQAAVEAPR